MSDERPIGELLPDDVLAWGRASRLPSTRDDALSVWE